MEESPPLAGWLAGSALRERGAPENWKLVIEPVWRVGSVCVEARQRVAMVSAEQQQCMAGAACCTKGAKFK
jgi:hypothetical protein